MSRLQTSGAALGLLVERIFCCAGHGIPSRDLRSKELPKSEGEELRGDPSHPGDLRPGPIPVPVELEEGLHAGSMMIFVPTLFCFTFSCEQRNVTLDVSPSSTPSHFATASRTGFIEATRLSSSLFCPQ